MRRPVGYPILLCCFSVAVLIAASPSTDAVGVPQQAQASLAEKGYQSLDDLVRYISADWGTLTRSTANCETYADSKVDGGRVLYVPADAAVPPALTEMQKRCSVRIARLPADVKALEKAKTPEHGLLFLENPYVVPGGQFNEMYGWDSYFIIRGLLRDRHRDLARGMVENFFYEIDHYGGVLNANRTYYLGRSQPPFLSSMILAVYDADQAAGKPSLPWLAKAYAYAVKDYDQWTKEPHLAGDTGLSRYYDEGEGPVPEIRGDPSHYYRAVVHYFVLHEGELSPHLVRGTRGTTPAIEKFPFQVLVCDSEPSVAREAACEAPDVLDLSPDAYKGDRSMRESGFDVTFRFGPYGVETHYFAPACLNSLLYKTENDLEEMSRLLGRADEASRWHEKAAARREKIVKYLWNPRAGLFFDYNWKTHTQSSYEYATTFYPLWAGLASKQQAAAVAGNVGLFEQAGGLAMSRKETQAQWDYPYGWAPVHLLAIEGLRRYGYEADASRLTLKFLSMVLENFRRDKTIREKYNVVTRSTETHITYGYAQNVTGFGWTNAVFLELMHQAPPDVVAQLRKE